MSDNGENKSLVQDNVLKRTVQSVPTTPYESLGALLTLTLASVGDDMIPWGKAPYQRDVQLRDFWPTEPVLAGTIYSLAIRDAAMTLTFDGPPRTVQAIQNLFNSANLGKGQLDFFLKLGIDLRTQDNGAFFELIRERDSETAAVIGINHLDALRCRRTGSIETPVIYTDRLGGLHYMKWYQIICLAELPSPIETMNGMQYCFVTRVLRAAQVLRDIGVYKREKIGARGPTDIHLVGGVAQSRIDDKLKIDHEKADNLGFARYMNATIIAGLDPTQTVSLVSVPIKSLPDGFDEDTTLKWYIAWLALNAGLDYQDLAPLPGGGLGTSQQSVTLDRKSRGKGLAFIQKLVLQALNFHGVLPRNVTARYEEEDNAAALDEETIRKARTDRYVSYATSLGMSKQVVYQIMVDDGEITPEVLAMLGEEDATEDVTATDTTPYEAPTDVTQLQTSANDTQQAPASTPPDTTAAPIPQAKEITGAVLDYASFLGKAVDDALNGKLTAKSLERSHKSYIADYAREAYLEGMAEGGVEDPENEIEDDEEKGIRDWQKQQEGFVPDFAEAVIAARGDESATKDIESRVDVWVKAMESLRGLGVVSAKGNVTGTFRLGSTKEHCDTCKGLNGKKKRMSKWRDSGLLPQVPGNQNFICGCWECKCIIEDNKGKQLYP